MVWYQLKIDSYPSKTIDALTDKLDDLGALSVMLTDKNDDPILEPEPGTTPLWPELVVQALFAKEEEVQYAISQLTQSQALNCSVQILPDKDWERACMDNFKAQKFGQRLWICPTWETPPAPDAVNIILDPGLAFGTGSHPTTSLCLTWLEQANLEEQSLIDYGCGSGILSIAALKLGAKHVQAIDIDNQALQATWSNAQSNQIQGYQLSVSGPELVRGTVDLIIANILLTPLIALKSKFYNLLNKQASLVVSGILTDQVPTLIDAYKDLFTHQTTTHQDEWSLLVFTCN